MSVQPPPGFILLNGKYLLVEINYTSANDNEPVPNYEYMRLIRPVICDIGNAIGALPIPTDAFSVDVPYGDNGRTMSLRCVIRLRYFTYPSEQFHNASVDGIIPDMVVMFVVNGDR